MRILHPDEELLPRMARLPRAFVLKNQISRMHELSAKARPGTVAREKTSRWALSNALARSFPLSSRNLGRFSIDPAAALVQGHRGIGERLGACNVNRRTRYWPC
jgi:hypothetical protein